MLAVLHVFVKHVNELNVFTEEKDLLIGRLRALVTALKSLKTSGNCINN